MALYQKCSIITVNKGQEVLFTTLLLFGKNTKSYGPVRKRGGGSEPPVLNQNSFFWKEKRWSCVRICILMKIFAKYVPLNLFYVLDYSGYFDMHIEKLWKKDFFPWKVRKKNGFWPYGQRRGASSKGAHKKLAF